MKFIAKIRKHGQSSLGITIPNEIVDILKLEEDEIRPFDILNTSQANFLPESNMTSLGGSETNPINFKNLGRNLFNDKKEEEL